MEILRLSGYSEEEKVEIAVRYLLPRRLADTGLTPEQLTVEPETLRGSSAAILVRRAFENWSDPGAHCPQGRPALRRGKDGVGACETRGLEGAIGTAAHPTGTLSNAVGAGRSHRSGVDGSGRRCSVHRGQPAAGARGGLRLTGQLGDVMRESAKAGSRSSGRTPSRSALTRTCSVTTPSTFTFRPERRRKMDRQQAWRWWPR